MDYATVTVIEDEILIVEVAQQGPPGIPGAGDVARYVAASPVSGHMAITLDASGSAMYADASSPAHRAVVGISTNAATTGDWVYVQDTGYLEHSGWAFTAGLPVFLGLNGALTQTVPPTAVFSKVLGMATTPTRINLDFQPSIFQ